MPNEYEKIGLNFIRFDNICGFQIASGVLNNIYGMKGSAIFTWVVRLPVFLHTPESNSCIPHKLGLILDDINPPSCFDLLSRF